MSDIYPQPQTAEVRLRVPLDYGTSLAEPGGRWDYVIVFPNPPKRVIEVSDERDTIIKRLRGAGLRLRLFYSVGKELVFCKIRAPEELMRREAEVLKMHLQLDPTELRRASFNGIPEYGIAPFPIRDVKQTYRYSPFDYIFAPYFQARDLQHFYSKKGPNGSLFSSTDRIGLIEHIITNHQTGAGQDIDRLIYEGIIVETYPLHEEEEKMDLKEHWIVWNLSPMNQPFDRICQYFGVKVALYFLYLGHYTKWLLYPTLVGIVTGITSYSVPRDNYNTVFAYISPLFGAFMTIWMTIYLENWKRLNSRETLRWGTAHFSETVNLRPQFYGERIPSPINGKSTRYFPPREKLKRVAYSWVVISFLILIVFVIVSSIFMLTYDLTKGNDSDKLVLDDYKYGSIVSSLANVVQITIMTKIYNYVSIVLVDQENHRTDMEYENSLIVKTVIFQFVNNYAGLFYVAFLKEGFEGCDISCMHELEYMLAIVFCSRLFVGNITEVAIPRLFVYMSKYRLLGHLDDYKKSDAERELFMAQYDWHGTFDDYTEMALQFGFTTMFVVAFPFAPLLSYVNNYFEIRLDAYRLVFESRRPRPRNVRSMGYWYLVLQAFAAISVCTNGAVVIFTGDFFNDLETSTRAWMFSIFIGGMFLFKYFLEVCIDDVPEDVAVQKYRQEFLISKCLYHMPDDDVNCPIGDECCDEPENMLTIDDEDSS
ncbi:Anoctamin-7 [Phytophthora citrophthora]|uniref:Anoctamin-7 n=1 Tax=Phytophthora citrophthora TaxID=4793 RepID=A0AAD9LBN0_9STRA|nr:Anoctamin-7 [Phytophthora citrophthora]